MIENFKNEKKNTILKSLNPSRITGKLDLLVNFIFTHRNKH